MASASRPVRQTMRCFKYTLCAYFLGFIEYTPTSSDSTRPQEWPAHRALGEVRGVGDEGAHVAIQLQAAQLVEAIARQDGVHACTPR